MIDLKGISAEWRALGRQLAEFRKAAGYTQHALAPLTCYGRSTIANAETGHQQPDRSFWVRCDQILRTGGVLAAGYDQVVALEQQRRRQLGLRGPIRGSAGAAPVGPVSVPGRDDDSGTGEDAGIESPSVILARIQEQATLTVDDALLDAWDLYIADLAPRYEHIGPAVMAPEVVRQRRRVQQTLIGWSPPRHRHRLITTAGRLSGFLCYMAVNLGRFASARAYGVEAFQLADHVGDDGLRAWVRGTESLTEYYAGRYDKARDLAVDGLRFAGTSHHAVRLLANGAARAHGKLGDHQAVDASVDAAYEQLSVSTPHPVSVSWPLQPGAGGFQRGHGLPGAVPYLSGPRPRQSCPRCGGCLAVGMEPGAGPPGHRHSPHPSATS